MAANTSTILDKVRESSQFVVENAKDVKINTEAIDAFLNNLDPESFKKHTAVVRFPVKFESTEEEINFLAILDLLNFGSGFRKPLHECCNRGAYDTICFGLMGLHLSGKRLDADYLSKISVFEVGDLFGIPLTKEKSVMTAVTTTIPSDLRPLAEFITQVLNDTGRILRNRMCKDLSEFILNSLTTPPLASKLVEKLASAFPAFNDKHTYKDQEVFILKKAQLLAADLYRRFGSTDSRFLFTDIQNLTVFSDNVVPAVLRKLGILQVSDNLAKKVDSGKVLKPGDEEVELRASAVVACEMIVAKSKQMQKNIELDPMTLDFYLWTIAKEPEFRGYERHYTQKTVFY